MIYKNSLSNPNLLSRYGSFLEQLTADNVKQLGDFAASEIQFRDPFNDCVGLDNFKAVMTDMFDHLESVRFRVLDSTFSEENSSSIL